MKTVRRIYDNFDRIYRADKVAGIVTAVLCHCWVIGAALSVFGQDYGRALNSLIFAVGFYLIHVFQLERNEARAELDRLRADSRP